MGITTFSGPVRSDNGFQEWNGSEWVPVAGGGGGGGNVSIVPLPIPASGTNTVTLPTPTQAGQVYFTFPTLDINSGPEGESVLAIEPSAPGRGIVVAGMVIANGVAPNDFFDGPTFGTLNYPSASVPLDSLWNAQLFYMGLINVEGFDIDYYVMNITSF